MGAHVEWGLAILRIVLGLLVIGAAFVRIRSGGTSQRAMRILVVAVLLNGGATMVDAWLKGRWPFVALGLLCLLVVAAIWLREVWARRAGRVAR